MKTLKQKLLVSLKKREKELDKELKNGYKEIANDIVVNGKSVASKISRYKFLIEELISTHEKHKYHVRNCIAFTVLLKEDAIELTSRLRLSLDALGAVDNYRDNCFKELNRIQQEILFGEEGI